MRIIIVFFVWNLFLWIFFLTAGVACVSCILSNKAVRRTVYRGFFSKEKRLCYGAGDGGMKMQGGTPHGGRNGLPYTALLRKQDKKNTNARDDKTASIRSYPKRLSPTVLSGEFYVNITGIACFVTTGVLTAAIAAVIVVAEV